MKKGKEEAKDKVSLVLNRETIITPSHLAATYINNKIKNQLNMPSLLAKRTFANKFIDYLKHTEKECIKHNKPIPKGFDKLRTVISVILDTNIKSHVQKLSQETVKLLKHNYKSFVIQEVLEAIDAFEFDVMFYATHRKFFKKFIETTEDIKKTQARVIKSCKTLLSDGALTNSEISTIQAIKLRYESTCKSKKQMKVDPVKEVELLNYLIMPTPLITMQEGIKWRLKHLGSMLEFTFKRSKGRPKDIFFKALQIVIYKLLTLEKPEKVKRGYKILARKLTANIINECYKDKDLPILTAKDIDNSLHSA